MFISQAICQVLDESSFKQESDMAETVAYSGFDDDGSLERGFEPHCEPFLFCIGLTEIRQELDVDTSMVNIPTDGSATLTR